MRASGLILLFGIFIHLTSAVSVAGEFQTLQLRGDKMDDYSGIVFGPVEQKDTLWKIAKDYRNSSDFVGQRPNSLYPVMYGIYLLNPQAFKDNNVNHLLNDTMLEMPTAAFMAKIDPLEAEAKIESDETLWAELQALKNAVTQASGSSSEEVQEQALPSETLTNPVSILNDKPTEIVTLPNVPTSQLTIQQLQVLNELKSQYAISLETIQVLLNENERLADQLQNVAERVDALSGRVNGDVQAQLDALGALQAEIYETLQKENAKQGLSTLEQVAEFVAKPFVLIALISLLVLLTLVGLGLWLFKRNTPKKSEELETLGEVDDEPLSELDEIIDTPTEQEVPDIASKDELAKDLAETTEQPKTQAEVLESSELLIPSEDDITALPDDLLELPDLDGWLNGDSDAEILNELENSDFDDILSRFKSDNIKDSSALNELQTKETTLRDTVADSKQEEQDTTEFDDLKFKVDTPDYIDVDALLDELDDEPVQNEPELDILQNIADKLPAQADVEVQESDAMGKLDLARAYIEIDEFSDAKALLNEVIKLGTETESAEAKQLLQQLNEL